MVQRGEILYIHMTRQLHAIWLKIFIGCVGSIGSCLCFELSGCFCPCFVRDVCSFPSTTSTMGAGVWLACPKPAWVCWIKGYASPCPCCRCSRGCQHAGEPSEELLIVSLGALQRLVMLALFQSCSCFACALSNNHKLNLSMTSA